MTAMPPEVDVVAYFLSRRESDADSNHFLAVLVPQLAFLVGEEPPPAPDRHAFLRLWEEAVEAARNQERHLLLIVDGLDEDLRPPDSTSVAARLPIKAGRHGHVLVTSRPYPELPIDVSFPHPLRQARPVTLDATEAAEEQQFLARQEIAGLLTTRSDLAIEVLRTMAAAAGPLAAGDLDALIPGASITSLRQFLDNAASRTVQRVGPRGAERYQFAHETLLATCQQSDDLDIGDRRQEIHAWAQRWRDADWPTPVGQKDTTPRYLFDAYPSTLEHEPERLVALVSDVGWIAAGVPAVGVDRVLADLGAAQSAAPEENSVATLLSALRAQAPYLRSPQPVAQPDYVLRQLCMQAAELLDKPLVADISRRLRAPQMKLSPIPQWTTRRASRALSLELGSHGSRVRAVAALPDGRLVSAGDDGRVRVWDPTGVAGLIELAGHRGIVRAVAALPDGRVASAGDDRQILLWDLNAVNAPVELGRHGRVVRALAVLRDGRVVSAGDDWRVLLWDPGKLNAAPVRLGGHRGSVRAVAVLPDGRVASAGDDRRVYVWNTDTVDFFPEEIGGHRCVVRSLTVLRDGRVVSGGVDGRIRMWNPATAVVRYRWPSGALAKGSLAGLALHRGGVRDLAVLPDGRLVSCGEGWIKIWGVTATTAARVELGSHDGVVRALSVLADGRVVSGGEDRRVRVWDPSMARTLDGASRNDDRLTTVALLPDGRVVSGGYDGRVLIWNTAQDDAQPIEIGRHQRGVGAIVLLPDGRVVSGGYDGRVLIWNTAQDDAQPIEIGRHQRGVRAIVRLPDGRIVSSGEDRRLLVWDPVPVSQARLAVPLEVGRHRRGVTALAALPDDRVISGGEDGRILMWNPDAERGYPVELGRPSGEVRALSVLPDGRVVSGGEDRRVRIWDPARPGSAPVEAGRHDGAVLTLVTLADGLVISGGDERSVRIWDVPTRTECARISCSAVAVAAARRPSADASQLAIAHEGSGMSVWTIPHRLWHRRYSSAGPGDQQRILEAGLWAVTISPILND